MKNRSERLSKRAELSFERMGNRSVLDGHGDGAQRCGGRLRRPPGQGCRSAGRGCLLYTSPSPRD
eukprot:2688681-Alexandrium_andersonii.AAC.1